MPLRYTLLPEDQFLPPLQLLHWQRLGLPWTKSGVEVLHPHRRARLPPLGDPPLLVTQLALPIVKPFGDAGEERPGGCKKQARQTAGPRVRHQ